MSLLPNLNFKHPGHYLIYGGVVHPCSGLPGLRWSIFSPSQYFLFCWEHLFQTGSDFLRPPPQFLSFSPITTYLFIIPPICRFLFKYFWFYWMLLWLIRPQLPEWFPVSPYFTFVDPKVCTEGHSVEAILWRRHKPRRSPPHPQKPIDFFHSLAYHSSFVHGLTRTSQHPEETPFFCSSFFQSFLYSFRNQWLIPKDEDSRSHDTIIIFFPPSFFPPLKRRLFSYLSFILHQKNRQTLTVSDPPFVLFLLSPSNGRLGNSPVCKHYPERARV